MLPLSSTSGSSFYLCRFKQNIISGLIDFFPNTSACTIQELRPKGLDVRQEELGDLVDKEMAATSAAIEEAVRRIDVSTLT